MIKALPKRTRSNSKKSEGMEEKELNELKALVAKMNILVD